MRKLKPWQPASASLLVFTWLAWLAGSWLGLHGWQLWVLRGGLFLLGLLASFIVFLLARRVAASAPPADPADEELDALLAAAQSRLAASGAAGGGRFGKLPLILVLGPSGSTKTSVVSHSGLEPELLAGEALRGEVPVPTASANVWFAQGTVVVEAGGKLIAEPQRWQRLVHRVQPSRAAAVLSRGAQAPRLALVCFGCDELLKPGASEAVPAAARRLRARLAEASERLGIRLPVYVLFTRADRLPYFDDFVRSLSRDEAHEVLGATLPITPRSAPGAYTEQENARLQDAFRRIIHSLALKRLDVLPRELQEDVRAGAYEFPRELRKAADLAIQFLIELTRPSQLAASPFLRGFYFTGVRAVLVGDAVPAAAPALNPSATAALDATSVFNPRALQAQAAQARAPQPGGARKVPEWVFLSRVFREVILRDRTAMGITAGGTRVNLLRRALVGAAAALFLVLAGGFTFSFFANRSLEHAASAAAAGVQGLEPAESELAPADALARLDELRAQTERLRRYEQDGRPWRLGWGLYTGDRLLPVLRRAYFQQFERLLWTRTRGRILAALQALPDEPNETSEYQSTYDLLKAHLVTTSHFQYGDSAFLAPLLTARWAGDAEPDTARLELARRQFAFFGSELPFGNPYADEPRESLVARTRAFLGRFAGLEPFYQALIAEASRAAQPVNFAAQFPGAAGTVVNNFTVPGAYTAAGWSFVRENLDNVDALFARETWVVGERAVSPEDRARLAREARSRFVADYIRTWTEYLRAGNVPASSNVNDAAARIGRLGGNQSPLLQMLALAAQNTGVDSATVGAAFQPLHQIIPADQADRLVNEANTPYVNALIALQSTLDQVRSTPPPERGPALAQAADNVAQARSAVRQMANNFRIEGEARAVGDAVQRLLLAPLSSVEAMIRGLPADQVNAQGSSFCGTFSPITRKYPFNPRAADEATIDDVSAAFQPGSSSLWAFYDATLQDLVVRQGNRYVARTGATPQPSSQFLAFFNQAAEISRVFYDESGRGPEVTFVLRISTSREIPEITAIFDAQRNTFSQNNPAGVTFDWIGERARDARIVGRIDNADVTLLEAPPGTWAVFRLFQMAEWQDAGGGSYVLRWRIPQRNLTLTAQLSIEGRVPIFRADYLSRLSCVSRIAR